MVAICHSYRISDIMMNHFITSLAGSVLFGAVALAQADAPVHLIPQEREIANTQKSKDGGVIPLKDGAIVELEKPFPIRKGTFSAWIRPINWNGETPDMVHLFQVHEGNVWWKIYKYQIDGNNYGLTFLFGRPSKKGERNYSFLTTSIQDWRKNEWHHIATTWNPEERIFSLYIDGEYKASSAIKEEIMPEGEAHKFEVAVPNVRPDGDIFRTAFDQVQVYDKVLSNDAIADLAKSEPANPLVKALESVPHSVATIPKVSVAPKIDGTLAPGEWEHAAKLFGGLSIGALFVHLGKTFVVYAAYDEERLYLMIVSPTSDMQLRADTQENGNVRVGMDDAVEIFLSPDGEEARYYQIIGNSLGYYYSSHAGDSKWRGKWDFANTLYEGFWFAEFAIPFSALGLSKAPDSGSRWKANFCRDWAAESMSVFSSWSYTGGSYFSRMGEIIFGDKDSGYALDVDAESLASGNVRGELRALSSVARKARVLRDDGGGVQNQFATTFSQGKPMAFSENLSPGRVSNVQIEADNGGIVFRQPIPVLVQAGVRLTVVPDLQTQSFRVSASLAKNGENQKPIIFRVKDDAGKTLEEIPVSFDDGKAEAVFTAKEMVEGRYHISLEQDGEVLGEKAYDHMGNAEWRTWEPRFKGVPSPWTPIEYGDESLGFWGRQYKLATDILPESITALNQPLVREPMKLAIVANGSHISWNPDAVWKKKEPTEGSYVLSSENAYWRITATVHFEFDGFWWVDLEFNPLQADSSLDELKLSIPFAPGVARFIYASGAGTVQGELTEASLDKFSPHIWIGNDDIGLTWAIESDQYWNSGQQATRFHPSADGGTLEIRMVDKSFIPGKSIRYGFGIQATPVRSFDERHRTRRIAPTINSNLAHPWAMDRSVKRYADEDKEWGFLSPHYTSIATAGEEFGRWRKKGQEMPWYVAPPIISPQSTEFQVFRDEWKNPHAVYQFACVNSSFAKFTNFEVENLVRNAGLRAVYVDCAVAYPCGNAAHGCGYRDAEGKLHLTRPVRALRSYLRGLYTTLHKEGGEDASLILHISAALNSMAHGFSDIVLEGEEVQYVIRQTPSYFDLYPPLKWRAIFGKALGINVMLLPNYGRVGPKEDRMSETLNATFMTQALLNDTPVWNLWTNEAYVNRIYAALDSFGWGAPEVRFEPYWKQDAVSVQGADLKVSIYHTAKGVLLAIGNFGKKPLHGKLALNLKKLGFDSGEASITNILSGAELFGEATDITVPQENFLLLVVQNKHTTKTK